MNSSSFTLDAAFAMRNGSYVEPKQSQRGSSGGTFVLHDVATLNAVGIGKGESSHGRGGLSIEFATAGIGEGS